jgi:hypothetical protein
MPEDRWSPMTGGGTENFSLCWLPLPTRLLPSLREAVGRGWGVSPRVQLPMSLWKHPPPPTPPRHALRARREGRRNVYSVGGDVRRARRL